MLGEKKMRERNRIREKEEEKERGKMSVREREQKDLRHVSAFMRSFACFKL